MKHVFFGLYALAAYCVGFASLLTLMAFLLNLAPWGIDGGATIDPLLAAGANSLLLGGYFTLHSIMARPAFKERWAAIIPQPLERSTYVLVSGLTLVALIALWHPLPGIIWKADATSLAGLFYGLHALGWAVMVLATFNINHFDFFGLGPAWRFVRHQPSRETPFSARCLYGLVRHPISLGWMIVFWTTPEMTVGHVLMAVLATGYILVVTPLEEKDLEQAIGQPYRDYQEQVPAFVPLRRSGFRRQKPDYTAPPEVLNPPRDRLSDRCE